MRKPVAAASTLAAVLVVALLPGASARAAEPPVNTAAPTITGEPVFRSALVADPGTWEPAEGLSYAYQWLRAGKRIESATRKRYRPRLGDIGRRLQVRVTATDAENQSAKTVSAATEPVRRAAFENLQRPGISGTRRYTKVLSADPGRWAPRRHHTRYRWFRGQKPIRGATNRRYRLGHQDVGHRIRVRVTVRKDGYRKVRSLSRRTSRIGHLVPVRRTATYRIETRGDIDADMSVFRRQVRQTLTDPRGWRAAGVGFRRVRRGGSFSVVLAEAGRVPTFSSGCSAQWSCRVGRYVVINQRRWLYATPSWNGANRPLRGYRHMVLNHETGHWLGHGHLGCPGRGRAAPVMMQQSKGLDGCRHNPWPLASERWYR